MWVYVDQRLDSTGSAYKTGEYIGRIGTFMIGQVQTSVGRSRRKRLDSFAYIEVKIAFSLVPRLSSRYPDKTATSHPISPSSRTQISLPVLGRGRSGLEINITRDN